jgi:hypothetical protein
VASKGGSLGGGVKIMAANGLAASAAKRQYEKEMKRRKSGVTAYQNSGVSSARICSKHHGA